MGINKIHARKANNRKGFSLEPWQVEEILETRSPSREVELERHYLIALDYLAANPESHFGRRIMAKIAIENPNFGAPQWGGDPIGQNHPLYSRKKRFDSRNPGLDYEKAANLFRDIYFALNSS